MKLIPVPILNILPTESGSLLNVSALPARLELTCVEKQIPGGWVLIRGHVIEKSHDSIFKLLIETDDPAVQWHEQDLPVSRKGVIHELMFFPENTRRLYLAPQTTPTSFKLVNLSISPVTAPERVFRMLRRVIPAFGKHPRERRVSAGLHSHTPLTDLPRAYQIVSKFRGQPSQLNYQQWFERFSTLNTRDRHGIRKRIRRWNSPPHFQIIIPCEGENHTLLPQTLASMQRQIYRHFEIILLTSSQSNIDGASLLRRHRARVITTASTVNLSEIVATEKAHGNSPGWVIVLPPGVTLAEHTLYWLGHEILQHKQARFLYSDHDHYTFDNSQCNPAFKPDWSEELLRATNYIGVAAAVRTDIILTLNLQFSSRIDGTTLYDLLFQATEQLSRKSIRHIPAILWHLPKNFESAQPLSPEKNPVIAHLQRLGISASTEVTPNGHTKVRYTLPTSPPLVSIIVPTRNAIDKLKPCIESVLGMSTYPRMELIVVDNDSDESVSLAYLKSLASLCNVHVLRYPGPFNYSAINNFAVQHAKGEVLCFLNNDTEVITADWLEVMLGHLIQPTVGAVGAKLLFANGRVQHAGVAVGPGGCANHLHAMLDRNAPGYCQRSILPQDLSAVTAACMITWRKLFLESGGFDQVNLAIAFNDVDYCLRIREAGFRVIWTPYAELYHYESVSRGKDNTPGKIKRSKREVAYMRKRWKNLLHNDPFYNPNLNYSYPDFTLSNAPFVKKPWTD